jgi:hypothetical protein
VQKFQLEKNNKSRFGEAGCAEEKRIAEFGDLTSVSSQRSGVSNQRSALCPSDLYRSDSGPLTAVPLGHEFPLFPRLAATILFSLPERCIFYRLKFDAPLAQLVEQLTLNQ